MTEHISVPGGYLLLAAAAWCLSAMLFPVATGAVTHFLLRVPATLTHEFAHAATALATGGFPTGLRVTSASGANVRSYHFTLLSRAMTPAAGYFGTPIVGALIVVLGRLSQGEDWAAAPYAVMAGIGIVCLLLSRNLLALVASLWLLLSSYVLMVTLAIPPEWFGLMLALMSTTDAGRLLRLHLRDGWAIESDATALSLRFIHPAFLSALWVGTSVLALVGAVAAMILIG